MLIAFSVEYALTPESFPVEYRNSYTGYCNISNRVASILAPLVTGMVLSYVKSDLLVVFVLSLGLLVAGAASLFIKSKI